MVIECQYSRENNESYASALLLELLAKASQRLNKHHERINPVSKALTAMNNSYKDNLSIQEYARMCGLSKYHFIRVFKANMGATPHAYKTEMLIEKSKNMLTTTNLNIDEVAEALGFEDAFYFSRIFKKATGLSPSEFRRAANYK